MCIVNFAQIAKIFYEKASVEEREKLVALEKEKLKATEDNAHDIASNNIRIGQRKVDAVMINLYYMHKVESFYVLFVPDKRNRTKAF